MKKTTIFKILVAILISLFIVLILSNSAFALPGIGNMFDGTEDKSEATTHMQEILGATISILQIIGAGIAIIMLIYIGINFAYQSPSGKAQFAKTARYYILGAILLFASSGLLQIAKDFAVKNIKNW